MEGGGEQHTQIIIGSNFTPAFSCAHPISKIASALPIGAWWKDPTPRDAPAPHPPQAAPRRKTHGIVATQMQEKKAAKPIHTFPNDNYFRRGCRNMPEGRPKKKASPPSSNPGNATPSFPKIRKVESDKGARLMYCQTLPAAQCVVQQKWTR